MPFNGTVLQVIPALDAGGAERTAVEIAGAVVKSGGKAIVVSAGGRLEAEINEAGGVVIQLPVGSKNFLTIYRNTGRLARLIHEHAVDIVHVRSRAPAWSALWAARSTGTKLVSTYHGAYGAMSAMKRFYNSGMLRADLVIANSNFTATEIRKIYDTTPNDLVVIPRGADLERFDPAVVEEVRVKRLVGLWGLPAENGELKLLAPGRLTSWKGQEDVVEALGILAGNSPLAAKSGKTGAGKHSKFRLVFCGDAQGRDAFEQALREKLYERGVHSMVHVVGHCADMPAAYSWADAVLAPSRRPEAFGRIAVEAGAMAKPVVATDHGGARETIIDDKTGILVPPCDPVALADAIEGLQANFGVRKQLGLAARLHVAENYSIKAMCNATLLAYQSLTHNQ